MDTVGKLTLTAAVEQNGKITGRIQAKNSMQGAINGVASVTGHLSASNIIKSGKLTLTGAVGQNGKITGHIQAINSMQGAINSVASVTGYLAASNIIESGVSTFIIVDEDGNEIYAALVDEEITVTATPNDIRKGTTAITGDGVVVGEKEIPSYYTAEGYKAVPKGSRFTISHADYDYDKLQAVICSFNTSTANSVAAIKVALENKVYDVNSTTALASVTKDAANTRIDLGITNDTGKNCVIRYFMYKEIY